MANKDADNENIQIAPKNVAVTVSMTVVLQVQRIVSLLTARLL